MSVLVVAVSITAPALSRFFRARTLDSEIRRVLALTRHGQSRAVAEGVPMELWIDSAQKRFGLEAEPSFEPNDPKEVSLMIEPEMQIEAVNTIGSGNAANPGSPASTKSNHPSLPRIRFLPDGSIEETSPQSIRVTGRDGSSRLVTISRTRMGYEIGGPAQ
jgi:Tfp pilus assembly protein FimT